MQRTRQFLSIGTDGEAFMKKNNVVKNLFTTGVFACLVGMSSLASAAFQGIDEFQGVTFRSLWDQQSSELTLSLEIGTLSGDWANAHYIEAIAINKTGSYPLATSVTLTGPGTFGGDIDASGLNAGGCQKFGQTSPHPCFTGEAELQGTLDFVFAHTNPDFDAAPHVKVFFTDKAGDKVGSLYSQNLNEVPLPAAAWLFGSGLIGLVGFARKRRVEQQL